MSNVFTVNCARIKNKRTYSIKYPANDFLTTRIREYPKEERTWNSSSYSWELKAYTLFKLIKSFRGSKGIFFDFGDIENKNLFIKINEKERIKEEEKLLKIQELNYNKDIWINYKNDLETNFLEHSEYVHSLLNKGVVLYPHQIIASLYLNKVRNALISHEMGLGKAQPIDSKILTPNGWKMMGDIKLNDFVIGSDGKPKKVLEVFPQGEKDIYEVKFNDGTSTQSCDEHLWNVNTQIRNWRKCSFQTKTLREIIDSGLTYKNGNNKYYIPIVNSIEFNEKQLKIDPYILGCLLGDGGLTGNNSVAFSSLDQDILDEISKRLPDKHNLILKKGSLLDYYVTADKKNNYINQYLKIYNLSGRNSYNKFIPDDYKFGSINQRLEILQGILDTDGHSRLDGIIELTLASKQLIDDTQFIIESLGGVARLHDKWVIYKGERRLYYRLTIKLPSKFIPFKLKRKIETFVAPTKYLPNRAIVEVNYIGKKEAQCILIDSEDHLYVTDHCILTHNTLVSIIYAEMNKFEKVIVITPNSLKFNYYYEVEKFTQSKAHILGWKGNKYTLEESKYIIFNYEFLNTGNKASMDAKWKKLKLNTIDCVISDESHRLKNPTSNTYKNYKKIFIDKVFRNGNVSKVYLSGTPTPNKAHELYTILNQISPIDFATKAYFYSYYCGMTYDTQGFGGWITDIDDQKFEELYYKISPYTHRKRKFEVLKDLPDKIYQKIMLEMDSSENKLYSDIERGIANEFSFDNTNLGITKLIRLRQYTSSLKVSVIYDLINDILDTGEKIVVVDFFKDGLNELKKRFGDIACLHTGDQTVEERSQMVKEFQDPKSKIKIFLGSIQTCNYGLTLTSSSKLFILTLPYSVGEYDQVSDRLHRISQKETVNIYPLIFRDSIDEWVFNAIEGKRKEINRVMDNEIYVSNVDESIITEVLKKLKEKYI